MNSSDLSSLYHACGILEVRANNPKAAADAYRRGIEIAMKGGRELDPAVEFLFHSLGMMELEYQRPLEAKKVFTLGTSLFPQQPLLLLGLAIAETKLGGHEQARKLFRSSIDVEVTHAHAWQAYAIFEKQCGNIELARALFREGLKNVPSHGAHPL